MQNAGTLEKEVDQWFADAKNKVSSGDSRVDPSKFPDPSQYPVPPSSSHSTRREARSRSKIFSIHFDAIANPYDAHNAAAAAGAGAGAGGSGLIPPSYKNRMSMRIAPSYDEFQQMNLQKNYGGSEKSGKGDGISFADYGTGISTTTAKLPFYRQPRQWLYLVLLVVSMTAFSLQGNINLRFGGTIIQNGRWNSLLIHSNWFVTVLVATSIYSLMLMVWYFFKKPSLPTIPYAFLASSVLWMAVADLVMHAGLFAVVLAMTIDVGVMFKSCYAQATKFNFSDKSSCVYIQWAVALASMSVALLLLLTAWRVYELKKIGVVRFGKRA